MMEKKSKKILWLFFGIILALGLLWLLIGEIDLSKSQIDSILEKFDLVILLQLIILTFIHLWLSAIKWQLAISSTLPSDQRSGFFFIYFTTIGAMLSELLPAYLSSTVVRGAALRIHHKVPVLHGSATSIFDQIFDVYVFALCAVASVFYFIYDLSFQDWVLLTITGFIIGLFGLIILARLIPAPLKNAETLIPRLVNWINERKPVLLRLYIISIVRFAVIVMRNLLILDILVTSITAQQVIIVSPLVQLSILLALTPGSIGIMEWTWTGLLKLLAIDLSEGAIYALANRVASFIAILCITVVIFMYGLYRRKN